MALGEFELIERFFSDIGARRDDVVLGIGDDAALVQLPPGCELVVAADTLVAGVHFPPEMSARAIGHRVLAVNLSDMAAMGAQPAWFTLALTLPAALALPAAQAQAQWLAEFSAGLSALAIEHGVALIGGDTTAGPLTLSVQILGWAPAGTALRRSGAQPGDVICVSGTLGDAAGGLAVMQAGGASDAGGEFLRQRFVLPQPRVSLGLALRGLATAAIDISDGLRADLDKLMQASGAGAKLELDRLPLSAQLIHRFGPEAARQYALAGGDDYELCFTVPASRMDALRRVLSDNGATLHPIGVVEAQPGIRCQHAGHIVDIHSGGYDHFRTEE